MAAQATLCAERWFVDSVLSVHRLALELFQTAFVTVLVVGVIGPQRRRSLQAVKPAQSSDGFLIHILRVESTARNTSQPSSSRIVRYFFSPFRIA